MRKIAIIMPICFLCLGAFNCESPAKPEEPPPIIHEYRYNIEVIYTRGTGDYTQAQDKVKLHYYLYDPSVTEGPYYFTDMGTMNMNKIGENKYRCYLHKVFIQTSSHPTRHRVIIDDWIINGGMKGESVDIQGAIEKENKKDVLSNAVRIWVYFKMSGE